MTWRDLSLAFLFKRFAVYDRQSHADRAFPQRECGASCPSGPCAGVVCTKLTGHNGDHEARTERRPGSWDLVEVWT